MYVWVVSNTTRYKIEFIRHKFCKKLKPELYVIRKSPKTEKK